MFACCVEKNVHSGAQQTVSEKYIWEILKICTKMSLVVEKKEPLKCFKQNDSNLLMLCFVSEKKKKKRPHRNHVSRIA